MNKYFGGVVEVLFEGSSGINGVLGHTKNYIPVYVDDKTIIRGKIYNVEITKVCEDFCLGELRY